MLRGEVGWVATVIVVVVVGVVVGIQRRSAVEVSRRIATRRRRSDRIVTVIVEAVGVRAIVVARARRHAEDHPRLVVRSVPAEAHGLEVFEGGEAVELIVQLVVGHDGVDHPSVETVERDVDGDSLDASGIHSDVFLGVVVAVVRVEVEGDITSIGVVADVLHVVVDRDRAVVIHHHGL